MNNIFNILLGSVAAIFLVVFVIGMIKEINRSMKDLHKKVKS
jgi:uncharacterized protein YoxC